MTSFTRDNDLYAWTSHYNINRLYTLNGLNQDTSAGVARFAYDGRGNLTQSRSKQWACRLAQQSPRSP